MPKKDVDYSNTIIYKICCKDESITDVYVGHTTNFIQRKYAHKNTCNNSKMSLKIYNVIRSNGGWNNWDMVEIAKYCCKDATEARIKEQYHYNEVKSSLNSSPTYVNINKYFCKTCNLQCICPKQYEAHINSIKHIKTIGSVPTMLTESCPKVAYKFCCESCDYFTDKKSSYDKHLMTSKHLELTKVNENEQKSCLKVAQSDKILSCKFCEKIFKSRVGLWKHNKNCLHCNNIVTDNDDKNDKLIEYLMKENKEMKELILEIVKNGTTNNIHNTTTHTNSHNKAFNLNFFLNETCKNAMNITDFVDSIKLQLSDFMEVGEVGYIQGISNIIVKKLNALDETIRPIHCTDQKRETFYVKDENKWEKEEEDFNRIRKMIKRVSYKNERLMSSYKEKYPDYNDPESKRSDHYSKTVIEALGGDGDNYKEKENKIIKNISRATHPSGKNNS